jgi:hypothetical protein
MSSKQLVIFGLVAATATLGPTSTAWAQDDDAPIDIEVGSSRIGGPGTREQRESDDRWNAAVEEEEMPMTEDSLPKKGDKKRLPGLHKLVKQYWGGKMWKDICDKLDQIVEENGDEGLDLDPEGRKKAHRAYYECGNIAFLGSEHDGAERLLKKSEKYGPTEAKHTAVRRKILKEKYHRAMGNGDVAGAMAGFKQYQGEQADEDERIWMGEELAKLAWAAYQSKDKISMAEYIKYADEVAPMNTELRKLKEKLHAEESVLSNVVLWGGGSLLLVFAGTQLSKWRARQKVKQFSGNSFEDKLDEEA